MSASTDVSPTVYSERIRSLDILRGFALLGILIMNIQSYAMISQAYFNPTAYGDLTGLNRMVWLSSHIFADQKFMTLFSLLFGAGIVLFSSRLEDRGLKPAGRHYLRTWWLILFGLLHAHLLWYGDILYSYGMCALVVYLFRKLSPVWLLVLGIVSLSVCSGLYLGFGLLIQNMPPDMYAVQVEQGWAPGAEKIAEEIAIYQGGWLEQMSHRSITAVMMQTMVFLIWASWRAGGLMLIGMALFKWGIFSAQRSSRFYSSMTVVGFGLGIPVVYYGVTRHIANGWEYGYSFFHGTQFNYWGSLFVSAGYIGLVMLLVSVIPRLKLWTPLAAVGQMAFTNYMTHSIICTFIFYGHGLGLYGQVERTGQILIVAGIWIMQLIWSPIWLSYFRFGPFEWLWRSLAYWKLQPFRR